MRCCPCAHAPRRLWIVVLRPSHSPDAGALPRAADHSDWDAKDWQWDPVSLTALPRSTAAAQISRSGAAMAVTTCFSPQYRRNQPVCLGYLVTCMSAGNSAVALQHADRHLARRTVPRMSCMPDMLRHQPSCNSVATTYAGQRRCCDAGAVAQLLTPAAANGLDPQQPPARPALSCSSGDSQAMTTKADAASSPPVSVRTSDERRGRPADAQHARRGRRSGCTWPQQPCA